MEVCEKSEAFAEDAFSHTKIILREGDQYYYAITSRRYTDTSKVDLHELDLVPISQIWPPFPTQFTRAPEPLPQDCYVKRPSLLDYGDGDDTKTSTELSGLLLSEAEVCEILRASPHPNIAQYLGCQVEDDKIMGLCFVKYGMNLHKRVQDSRPFDTDLILQGIQQGIRDLHSLGLIHCDISPANIVMDHGDTPVIVDFDSCRRNGEELGPKRGTWGWTNEDSEFARPENDEYGLSKIRDFLSQVHKM